MVNEVQAKFFLAERFQVLPAVHQLLRANACSITWFRTNVPHARHTLYTVIGSALAQTLCQKKLSLHFVDHLMISM
jgi:hypothetical protein